MQKMKTRGRPKDSGFPIDRVHLAAIADRLLENPDLRPTSAVKLVVPDWTDSIIRRLSRKLRDQREHLLMEAQQRQQAKAPANPKPQSSNGLELLARNRAIAESLASQISQGHHASMVVDSAIKIMDSPTMKAARGEFDSTTRNLAIGKIVAQAIQCNQAYQKSSVGALIEALFDSPTMRFARGLDNSAAMRAIDEINKSPTARLLLEQQRALRSLGSS